MSEEMLARSFEAALQPYLLKLDRMVDGLRLSGHAVAVNLASKALDEMGPEAERGGLARSAALDILDAVIQKNLKYDLSFRLEGVHLPVRPLNLAQVAFMNALLFDDHPLIFGVGPTGTGKTHLAMAAGLNLLARGMVQHLVITRPDVLGEGEVMTAATRAELVNQGQLTPIEDELHALVGQIPARSMIDAGKIEVVPLGLLRGRTFNESFILIDEAQNLTIRNMRMALTRMGRESRTVVTGDPRQIDLRSDEESGLPHILKLLGDRNLALEHHFRQSEIIRNPLVAELEALYASEDDRVVGPAAAAA